MGFNVESILGHFLLEAMFKASYGFLEYEINNEN